MRRLLAFGGRSGERRSATFDGGPDDPTCRTGFRHDYIDRDRARPGDHDDPWRDGGGRRREVDDQIVEIGIVREPVRAVGVNRHRVSDR